MVVDRYEGFWIEDRMSALYGKSLVFGSSEEVAVKTIISMLAVFI